MKFFKKAASLLFTVLYLLTYLSLESVYADPSYYQIAAKSLPIDSESVKVTTDVKIINQIGLKINIEEQRVRASNLEELFRGLFEKNLKYKRIFLETDLDDSLDLILPFELLIIRQGSQLRYTNDEQAAEGMFVNWKAPLLAGDQVVIKLLEKREEKSYHSFGRETHIIFSESYLNNRFPQLPAKFLVQKLKEVLGDASDNQVGKVQSISNDLDLETEKITVQAAVVEIGERRKFKYWKMELDEFENFLKVINFPPLYEDQDKIILIDKNFEKRYPEYLDFKSLKKMLGRASFEKSEKNLFVDKERPIKFFNVVFNGRSYWALGSHQYSDLFDYLGYIPPLGEVQEEFSLSVVEDYPEDEKSKERKIYYIDYIRSVLKDYLPPINKENKSFILRAKNWSDIEKEIGLDSSSEKRDVAFFLRHIEGDDFVWAVDEDGLENLRYNFQFKEIKEDEVALDEGFEDITGYPYGFKEALLGMLPPLSGAKRSVTLFRGEPYELVFEKRINLTGYLAWTIKKENVLKRSVEGSDKKSSLEIFYEKVSMNRAGNDLVLSETQYILFEDPASLKVLLQMLRPYDGKKIAVTLFEDTSKPITFSQRLHLYDNKMVWVCDKDREGDLIWQFKEERIEEVDLKKEVVIDDLYKNKSKSFPDYRDAYREFQEMVLNEGTQQVLWSNTRYPVTIYKRTFEGRYVWVYLQSDEKRIKKNLGVPFRYNKKTDVVITRDGLKGVFSDPKSAYEKISGFINVKEREDASIIQVIVSTEKGTRKLQKVKRKRGYSWSLKRRDVFALAQYFDLAIDPGFRDGNEQKVYDFFGKKIEALFPGDLKYFAFRYSRDVRGLIWRVIPEHLADAYDQDYLTKLFHESMLSILMRGAQDVILNQKTTDVEFDEQPEIFQSRELQDEDLKKIADALVVEYGKKPVKEEFEKERVSNAVNFFKKLEYSRLFKKFEAANNKESLVDQVLNFISDEIELENNEILKETLRVIYQEIEDLRALEKRLYDKGGVLKDVNRNLYQLLGIAKMLDLDAVLNADKMGLGKTLQALATFLLSDEKEMIVFAPNKAMSRWMEEIVSHTYFKGELVLLANQKPISELSQKQFQKRINTKVFQYPRDRYDYLLDSRDDTERKRIILVPFESVPEVLKRYRKRKSLSVKQDNWGVIRSGMVVVDEAQNIKNETAKTTQMIVGMKGEDGFEYPGVQADKKLLLTGTPLENSPEELIHHLKFILKGLEGYKEDYWLINNLDLQNLTKKIKGLSRKEVSDFMARISLLHSILSKYMVRRHKEDVMRNLPDQEFDVININSLTGEVMNKNGEKLSEVSIKGIKELYEYALFYPQDFELAFKKRSKQEHIPEDIREIRAGGLTQYRRLEQIPLLPSLFKEGLTSPKLELAEKMVKDYLAEGKNVVVYTGYVDAAAQLRDSLKKDFDKSQLFYISGEVKDTARKLARTEQVRGFQNLKSKNSRVMIATTGVADNAIELSSADVVIFLDYPWKASTLNQLNDRAHRYAPLRNYMGKVIEYKYIEFSHPFSFDAIKRRIIQMKEILEMMAVEGNLSPEILNALEDVEGILTNKFQAYTDPLTGFGFEDHSQLHKYNQALRRLTYLPPESFREKRRLWDEIAQAYYELLHNKTSVFWHIGNFRYLASKKAPDSLKGKKKIKMLDLASGSSIGERSYQVVEDELAEKDIKFEIWDYDWSKRALELGIHRDGRQVIGALENLSKWKTDEKFDVINMTNSLHLTTKPKRLFEDIYDKLEDKGVVTIELPSSQYFTRSFFEAVERAGFGIHYGDAPGHDKVSVKFDSDLKKLFDDSLGEAFTEEMKKEVSKRFSYLVLVKKESRDLELVEDGDFKIAKKIKKFMPKTLEKLHEGGALSFLPGSVRLPENITSEEMTQFLDVRYEENGFYLVVFNHLRDLSRRWRMFSSHENRNKERELLKNEFKTQLELLMKQAVIHQNSRFFDWEEREEVFRLLQSVLSLDLIKHKYYQEMRAEYVEFIKNFEKDFFNIENYQKVFKAA